MKTFVIAGLIFLINSSDGFSQQLLDSLVHQNTVYGVDLAHDTSKIFTAGKDSIGRVWNLDGKLLLKLKEHKHSVSSIKYNQSKHYFNRKL